MAIRSILKRARSPSPQPSTSNSKRSRLEHKIATNTTVKFLIVSDTHDAELQFSTKCDVLLHCGDLTEDGSPASLEKALKGIGSIDAELKLVIAGNHEISLDRDYYLSEEGSDEMCLKAHSFVSGVDSEASKKGIVFLSEGTYSFTLHSGAVFKIHTSPWTPKYGSSAFQYPTNEDRFNFSSPEWAKNVATNESIIPEGVDIVMTHGPPKYILDATGDGRSAGCEHLRRAIARVQPRLHCFGHIHRGYGAQRFEYDESRAPNDDPDCMIAFPQEWVGKNQAKRKGYACLPPNSAKAFREDKKQTLMINAAMMDERDEPSNVPWMVELDLPVLSQIEEIS